MSENEREYTSNPQTENKPAVGQAAAAFVVGLLLAGLVLYFAIIAPRGGEFQEAQETITGLEEELTRIDARDAELQENVAALEAELQEDRDRLAALRTENEQLENDLEEARAQSTERVETIERLEEELTELRAAMGTMETRITQAQSEKDTMEASLREMEAALEEREDELEEMREAYLVAVREVERAETERDELREQMDREIRALEEQAAAVRAPRAEPVAEPQRYLRLLTAFHAARHEGVRAENPQQARAAWGRAGQILDTLEEEFPDRSVDRLRRDLQALQGSS